MTEFYVDFIFKLKQLGVDPEGVSERHCTAQLASTLGYGASDRASAWSARNQCGCGAESTDASQQVLQFNSHLLRQLSSRYGAHLYILTRFTSRALAVHTPLHAHALFSTHAPRALLHLCLPPCSSTSLKDESAKAPATLVGYHIVHGEP